MGASRDSARMADAEAAPRSDEADTSDGGADEASVPAADVEERGAAEVVVVGAGPAGAVLSYLLARSGVDVVLCERHGDLAREFRGYLFQPRVVDLFEKMGVLEDVLALPHDEVVEPEVDAFGEVVVPFSMAGLPTEHSFGLLMEQPALLRYFVDRASEYETFTYRDRTPVEDLVVADGTIQGVTVHDRGRDERETIPASVVVGADGRYSMVREVAGIDPGLFESDAEVVWFKLPADAVSAAAVARVAGDGFVLYFGLGGDEAQAGIFVEKGEFRALREAGIDAFYDRVLDVDPSLDGALQAAVPDYSETSLLHIEPGLSERWVDDGLLLVGDAAHVASPVGGQGNSLAIQDAVVAHPLLVDAVRDADGPVPASTLRAFEERRRPEVERVLRGQRRGERTLTWYLRNSSRLPLPVRRLLVRTALRHARLLPNFEETVELFTLGPGEFDVATDTFVD